MKLQRNAFKTGSRVENIKILCLGYNFELKNRTRYRSRFGRKFQEILKENERDKNSFIPKDDHKDVAGQLMEKILTDAVKQVSVTIR